MFSYLIPKGKNKLDIDYSAYIHDRNIYDSPSEIFQEIPINHQSYFFTELTKTSSNSKRIRRATLDGTWKEESKIDMCDIDGLTTIGAKKNFSFQWKGSKEEVSERGNWTMHEYSLLPEFCKRHHIKKEYVLCMIKASSSNKQPPRRPREPSLKMDGSSNTPPLPLTDAALEMSAFMDGKATVTQQPTSTDAESSLAPPDKFSNTRDGLLQDVVFQTTIPNWSRVSHLMHAGSSLAPPESLPSSTQVPLNTSLPNVDGYNLMAGISNTRDGLLQDVVYPMSPNRYGYLYHPHGCDQSFTSNMPIENGASALSSSNTPPLPFTDQAIDELEMSAFMDEQTTVTQQPPPESVSSSTRVPLNSSLFNNDDTMGGLPPGVVSSTTITSPDWCHYPYDWDGYDQLIMPNVLIDNNASSLSFHDQYLGVYGTYSNRFTSSAIEEEHQPSPLGW